jgi:hypothetical protein
MYNTINNSSSINDNKLKYIIYKSSGGLNHNLNGLQYAIYLSEKYNRKLIIDTKINSAFKINFSDIFIIHDNNINYQDTYENIDVSLFYVTKNGIKKTFNDIALSNLKLVGRNYCIFNENECISLEENINLSNDIIIIAGCKNFSKKIYDIQINNNILNKLLLEESINQPYISIHYRNTDIKNDITIFIKKIADLIVFTKINNLYISSDYYDTYNIIKTEFPNLNIIRKTIPDKGIYNLHYSKNNKYDMLYETIRDIYFVSKSNYFIPSYNSGLSDLMIKQIKGDYPIIPNIKSNAIIIEK